MTNTRAIDAAAGVIHACLQQGKAIPTSIAYALDSACLLNSPETAAELVGLRKLPAEVQKHVTANLEAAERAQKVIDGLRARVAELEARAAVVEDAAADVVAERMAAHGIAPQILADPAMRGKCGRALSTGEPCPDHPSPAVEDVSPQVQQLRGLLARQREDAHDSPLHHTYAVGRDFPEVRP